MNKKIIAGAVIVLAAGVVAFIYNKNRNSIKDVSEDVYDDMNDSIYSLNKQTENIFS